jgi:3-isopropylmalate/(R)-2-methylmalate dehydratase small subunit
MAEQGQLVTRVTGSGVPVRGNDIDTDRIIPARYMKVVTFDGLGEFAFRDVRIKDDGTLTDHPFNLGKYENASILIVNNNFGCGSSREHAPQALMRWGINGIIGESFAEIFAGNCNALGIPAVTIPPTEVERLMDQVEADPGMIIEIDVNALEVRYTGQSIKADLPSAVRESLVAGTWDSTSALLSNEEAIKKTVERLPYTSGFAR